jgi:hypothetical protein
MTKRNTRLLQLNEFSRRGSNGKGTRLLSGITQVRILPTGRRWTPGFSGSQPRGDALHCWSEVQYCAALPLPVPTRRRYPAAHA